MRAHRTSKTMNARRGGANIEIITRDQVIELNPVWWFLGWQSILTRAQAFIFHEWKNRSVVWRSWLLVREKSTWRNQAGMVIVLAVLSALTVYSANTKPIKIQRGPRGDTHLPLVHRQW